MDYLTKWTPRDRALAAGLLAYEASLNEVGIPSWIAQDPEIDGWYEVEEYEDYVAAALDRWRQESKEPAPGMRARVLDTRES
jgi:hypothetical protein